MSLGSMGGMDSFIAAEAEQPKEKKELSAETIKLQEETLNLLKDHKYQVVIDMMNAVVDKYPELFLPNDTETDGDDDFKAYYEFYKDGFKNHESMDDYYKFIDKVIKPFWAKVDKAGPEVISREYFAPVRTIF